MVTGNHGDGKTSLIQALLGKPIPDEHIPTDGMDSKYSCKVDITKCTEDWSELFIDKTKMVDYHVATGVIKHAKHEQQCVGKSTSSMTGTSKSAKVTIVPSQDSFVPSNKANTDSDSPEKPETKESKLVKEDDKRLFNKVNESQEINLAERPEDKAVIFLWDFGGQKVYTNLHPIFLRTDCIHIVEYDLEKLENARHEEEWENYPEQIEFWLQMIQANRKISRYAKQVKNVLLVGTHKDRLQGNSPEEKEQCAEELITNLKEKLTGKNYKDLITEYFHVDSKAGIKGDPENFKKLKECLIKSIQVGRTWEENMPIPYMRLLSKLYDQEMKPGHAIMKVEEIKQYAAEFGIACQDVKNFLQFHHGAGDLTYFPDPGMKDFVIVNAQWLIDVFTRVITIDRYYKEVTDKEELNRLKTTGLIKKNSSLLADLWGEFLHGTIEDKAAQIDHLKHLMCKFDLMMDLGEEHYLIPCLMKSDDKLEPPNPDYRTIYLQFHASKMSLDNFLPPVLFHQLICRLASSQNISWTVDFDKSQRNHFIFRNFDREIILASQSSWIRLSLVDKTDAEEILRNIRRHLDQLIENCYHNMWYEFNVNPCEYPELSKGRRYGEAYSTRYYEDMISTGYSSIGGELKSSDCNFWFGK